MKRRQNVDDDVVGQRRFFSAVISFFFWINIYKALFLLNSTSSFRYIVSAGWDRRINIYSDNNDSLHHVKHPYIKWPDDIPVCIS